MRGSRLGVWALGCLWLAAAALPTVAAEVQRPFLHPLFSDHMVFPRDLKAPVWGWTTPGAKVQVKMGERSAEATAGPDGKWQALLGPFAAGGPFTLAVTGPQTVTLSDVLTGDVWICSGQSNMLWGVGGVVNAEQEIAAATLPQIRLLTVPCVTAYEPRDLFQGAWQECSPATVGGFSAVGFFFGRQLHQDLGIPIGLINSSWGGTIAEAWVSSEALKTMPDFLPAFVQQEALIEAMRTKAYSFEAEMERWWAANDPGSAEGRTWAAPELDTAGWKAMALPAGWEQAGLPGFDGIAWFRRAVEVPAEWSGKACTLHLGPIDDMDTTFVNGKLVGATNTWQAPRDYAVPAGVIKAGRNLIAVRVLDTGGAGGLYGKPEDLRLEPQGGGAAIPLNGAWQFRDSVPLAQTKPVPQRLEQGNPNQVSVLYNAMISPLLPFGIRGAIWYQGESNAGRHEQYARLLPTLIRDWRARFGVGDFPFLIVQLANFMAVDAEPKNDAWPLLREAQWLTTQAVPKAALALAIDIGDAADIHPRNKQDVGRRLALGALALSYDRKVEYSGPVYRDLAIEGGKVRVRFDHLGGGLVAKGDSKVTGFAIAGADGRFVWADATIDGETVVVKAAAVAEPKAVRYAWANNPVCNLYNQAGLPALPFRTDR
jgi:sialate O-acetylesterase